MRAKRHTQSQLKASHQYVIGVSAFGLHHLWQDKTATAYTENAQGQLYWLYSIADQIGIVVRRAPLNRACTHIASEQVVKSTNKAIGKILFNSELSQKQRREQLQKLCLTFCQQVIAQD